MITFRDALLEGDELPPALAGVAAEAGVIEAIVAVDRMLASLTAAKLRLVEFAHATHLGAASHALAEREFRAELAAALRISERAAEHLVTESEVLVRHLPATHAALAEGALTPRQASILVDELAPLDESDRPEVERRALAAADRSAPAFAREVRRIREGRTPEQAIERHRAAHELRSVRCEPGADGMGWTIAHLPAAESLAIDSRLDDLARGMRRAGDTRTLAQLRADALVDVLLDRDSRASRRFGDARPTVVVTVPVSTLAGDDTMARLEGYGPIDAETARDLVGGAAVLRRILTDPRDDAMLALGRRRYRVTDELRLWLTVRDERCRFPGCTRRASASDVDHSRAWADGGATDPRNLAHLCRGHHTLKHDSRWRLEATHPDGSVDWVSPAGRRYRSSPARATAPDPP